MLRSEDLFAEPARTLAQVYAFLGLSNPDTTDLVLAKRNSGQGEAANVSTAERQSLRAQLEPTYSWAASTLGLHWSC